MNILYWLSAIYTNFRKIGLFCWKVSANYANFCENLEFSTFQQSFRKLRTPIENFRPDDLTRELRLKWDQNSLEEILKIYR